LKAMEWLGGNRSTVDIGRHGHRRDHAMTESPVAVMARFDNVALMALGELQPDRLVVLHGVTVSARSRTHIDLDASVATARRHCREQPAVRAGSVQHDGVMTVPTRLDNRYAVTGELRLHRCVRGQRVGEDDGRVDHISGIVDLNGNPAPRASAE
jgi:hypothetical protein